MSDNSGKKFDEGKSPISLVDSDWIMGVAKVLAFGAVKYDRENWRKGIKVSRLYDAAQRHLLKFNKGIDLDEESNIEHILHASVNLMMIYAMLKSYPELDDRYKKLDV